jgi:transcriptional regulator with GAF, ATPase, and Fis domain
MDENLFFKKATLLLCSSLDVEVALWRCFEFIQQHFPADSIYLNIYEPSISGIRYIAMADASGGRKIEHSIQLPADLIQAIESGQRLQDYLIINSPAKDPLGQIITSEFDLADHSLLALRLFIEGHRLGVIDLFAKGRHRFTEEDARLISQLREPFAIAMANALKHQEVINLKEELVSDNRFLHSELISKSGDEVIGAKTGLKDVMTKVGQINHLKNTVLILGETGTGKEVVANAIHRQSPRHNEPFIKVNCGAIPENLIDSELFGHEKGAFTGAVKQKRGRFERAHKGTIFLDEIGELPPWAQIRLLRVLQTQEIERVGGSPPIKLDVRVIAATHRDLEKMVREGLFREDLWFRINMFPISIPPLRARVADISLLMKYFLEKKSKELGIHPVPSIATDEISNAMAQTWPGNVRELENSVERSLILHRQGPLYFHTMQATSPDAKTVVPLLIETQIAPLNEVVSEHILRTLKIAKGKVNGKDGAAALLGVHPNTLRNRMAKLGIKFGRKHKIIE